MSRSQREYPGVFIVLEGIDGAGTTTQLERLAKALREDGYRVTTTRQPSDGPVGTLIRQALTGRLSLPNGTGPLNAQTLALLFAADRTDHLEAQILPALERGDVVLCDRYVLSSIAYQGQTLPQGWVSDINAFATPPDLTLFFKVDPKVAGERRAARGAAAELFEDDEQQRQIARDYETHIRVRTRSRNEKIVRINGGQSPEKVTEAALRSIRPVLKKAERATLRE